MSLTDDISRFTGFDKTELGVIEATATRAYKRYEVPKPSGGMRTIYHPDKRLKAVQYAVLYLIGELLPIHTIACAYRSGLSSPVRTVCTSHAAYRFTVRIDLIDFFYSITPDDFHAVRLDNNLYLSPRDQEFLTKVLFLLHYNRLCLSIGAPTSPAISNAVMYSLDHRMTAIATSIDPDSIVSRYADDIVFSTNMPGRCADFVDEIKDLLSRTTSPKLSLNGKKTVFMSRGTRRMILGLIVTPDGQVSIGRGKKRYVRGLVNRAIHGHLDESEMQYLSGYLNYVRDVEPSFINSLVLKYGSRRVSSLVSVGPKPVAGADA